MFSAINENGTKEKKQILFLHGYMSEGRFFYPQINFLKNDYELFYPTLKGFGENVPMEYPYKLDDYIKEVKDYMAKNNIIKPYVVAHSFGARIVLKMAYNDNNIFDKIVITGGAGLKPKFSIKKFIKKSIFNLLKRFINREKLQKFYSKDYQTLSPVMKKSFSFIVGENLDYTLNKIDNKVLLLWGEKDRETPLYMAKKFRKNLKNSKLIVIKNAGHFAFLDRPNKFNMEIKEFFAQK